MPADRHALEIDAIRDDVLSEAGLTDRAERSLVTAGGAPTDLQEYLAKVRHASYRVTDEDIAALRRAGLSEDAIYELTVAASLGVAYDRLEVAKRAMRAVP